MESALTPREIQARIRGGESVAEVAEAAGVPVDRIEVYAGPVLAEREHLAMQARTSPVRRRGEFSAQRRLGEVVADALETRGVPAEQIVWDAWRDEDRRWTVQASWLVDQTRHAAHFDFDQRGRYSAASDDEARVLINERPPAVKRSGDPDAEPTIDLNDELAIVRVVQDEAEPPAVLPDVPAARIIKLPGAAPGDDDDSEPEDYSPVELEQVDGIYDIIPNPQSDMDVLYDMLAGFNEDSVRIYAGLTQPVSPAPELGDPAQSTEELHEPTNRIAREASSANRQRRSRQTRPTPPEPSAAQATKHQASPVQTPRSQQPPTGTATVPSAVGETPPQPEQPPAGPQPPRPKPASTQRPQPRPSAPQSGQDGPQQDALMGDSDAATPRASKRRKRASVPTWDEIVFGGPTPPR